MFARAVPFLLKNFFCVLNEFHLFCIMTASSGNVLSKTHSIVNFYSFRKDQSMMKNKTRVKLGGGGQSA